MADEEQGFNLNPLGLLADVGFGIYDRVQQNKINQQNVALQKQANAQNQANFDKTFDYQQQLNAQMMAREDNAMQRAVADAQAAGFSKWSVAGQGAQAGAMSSATGGQSVANGAKNSAQISQTAFGAEMAQMRASTAQAYAVKKQAEVDERRADAELRHMKFEENLSTYKTKMDFAFGVHDRSLAERNYNLAVEKQREVAENNAKIIEETSRHNVAVEEETHRSNVRSEQQKSQELDIQRVNLLCREEENKLTKQWYQQQKEAMLIDKEYKDKVTELEEQGIKQKYAQMIVSGVVDIAKTIFIGYGATHAIVPQVKPSAQYQGNSGVGFHAD